jgi:hypothetical protein
MGVGSGRGCNRAAHVAKTEESDANLAPIVRPEGRRRRRRNIVEHSRHHISRGRGAQPASRDTIEPMPDQT